jgi:dsDNA-binding SOS-regulon protein
MLNEDLKKQIDARQSVLDAFDDKLNHLKQTVQNLNEKFNERNKIEVYLSKNGIKSDLVSKILKNSSFFYKS